MSARSPYYQRDIPFGLTDRPHEAEAERTEAPVEAALRWLRGDGVPADPKRGLTLLRGAAEANDVQAALLLGKILWSTPEQAREGVRWLRVAAEAGQDEAWYVLGLAALRGQGVERDAHAARRLVRRAAEQGLADAQFELSLMLAQGLGGEVDEAGARHWEEQAAQARHPRACLNRAVRAAAQTPPDFRAARRWYIRAAEAGNAEAAARLSHMYLRGLGIRPDANQARVWFERAATLGFAWEGGERR